MNRPAVVSLVSIALAAIVCLWQVPGLIGAAFPPDADGGAIKAELSRVIQTHAEGLELYRDRFDGRSAFFRPKARYKPPPPVAVKPRDEPPKPAAPPPPQFYTGPKPAFVIGQEVYFEGGTSLRVGQNSDGVTVVETDPPWTITLEQHGKSHVIDIFKRSSNSLGSSSAAGRSSGSALPPGMTVVNPAKELAQRDDDDASGDPTGN